jgi:RNA polymerase sigma-70 factor, ECF subfamily
MKHVTQLCRNLGYSGLPLRESPGAIQQPVLDKESISEENGWNKRQAALGSVADADRELVSQSCAGSKEAFEQLVLRHKDRLYTLACRMLGDHGEAEDVTQETFLRAYERLEEFRGDARFSTWLYRICYNLCVNRFQFQRKDRNLSNGSAPEAVPSSTIGSCEQLLVKEQQQLMNWALSRLKAEFREAVLLYHTEHLSYEEIADVLGSPVGTVRSRIHRGREDLNDMLRPYFAEA